MNRALLKWPIMIACLLLLAQQVVAEPLYLEQLETVTPTDKDLQKARQQIEEHKDIKVLDKLAVAPFHKRHKQLTETKQAFCLAATRLCPTETMNAAAAS